MEKISDKARKFAIEAHKGQYRKNEPEKPMIIHTLGAGKILEKYGYSDTLVAAAYLHDVVEDTDYTTQDIERVFGEKIANLVATASELDRTHSWEERKKHSINKAKKIPLENKLIIAADKISNIEDLEIKFIKEGKRDFSYFNRGEENQKWYYEEMYKSLVYGEDKDLPIFIRLKNDIDRVFHDKHSKRLETVFENNTERYDKLKVLDAKKKELYKLKEVIKNSEPYIVEFIGTPRTGKTSIINNLYDFFKKGGFDIKVIEEFVSTDYYKNVFHKEQSLDGTGKLNIKIIEEVTKQIKDAINENHDIILVDRGINDRQIWNYKRFLSRDISKEAYEYLKEYYKDVSHDIIDVLVTLIASSDISIKRDYNHYLALEERKFLNQKNVDNYNNLLNDLKPLFEISVNDSLLIDTDYMTLDESTLLTAEYVMSPLKRKYLRKINEEIK